jgi:hypothetical protein
MMRAMIVVYGVERTLGRGLHSILAFLDHRPHLLGPSHSLLAQLESAADQQLLILQELRSIPRDSAARRQTDHGP